MALEPKTRKGRVRKDEDGGWGIEDGGREDMGGSPVPRGDGGALGTGEGRGAEPSPQPSPGVPGEGVRGGDPAAALWRGAASMRWWRRERRRKSTPETQQR